MRHAFTFRFLALAAALVPLSGCDLISGHGNVDVTNNTGKNLASITLTYEGGEESSGAVANGIVVHFTGITEGTVGAVGTDSSGATVGGAVGTLKADQTIALSLEVH